MTTNTPHTASLNSDGRAAGDASTQGPHSLSDAQTVALLRQWVEDYQAHPEEHSYFPSVARMFFEAVKALADEEKRRTASHGAACEQHMAARHHAYEEALVVLDRNGDIALDYGDGLHLITVLQRAIAAHDITLFGDGSQEQPIDAREGYNQMRLDAEALAHLTKTFCDDEWRSSHRLEAGINIDD